MREIKFRAWDKKNRQMLDIVTLVWQLYENPNIQKVLYGTNKDGNLFYLDWDEVELIQYTGLKDKNGKEIFEGNTVKEGKLLKVVEYIEYGFFPFNKFDSDGFCGMYAKDVEVIGNMWENGDLLK